MMGPHGEEEDIERGSVHDSDDAVNLGKTDSGKTDSGPIKVVEEPEGLPPRPIPVTHDAMESHQLQELQRELSEFLAQHIAKSMALQNSLHDPLKIGIRKRGSLFDRENASAASPGSTGNIAVYHHEPPLSRFSLGVNGSRPFAINSHNEALDRFLGAHMNNLQTLQDSLRGTNEKLHMPVPPPIMTNFDLGNRDSQYSGCMQEFAVLIASMTLEAIFIVTFLQFTHGLVAFDASRIPFSVAMLFSFFCLTFLLLGLVLSLWGMVAASWRHLKNEPESQVQVHFYLFLGRQLLFCAAISFILPVTIMTFYIFFGIAFPVVNLVFLLVAFLVVLGSVVYRVPISLENVGSIVLSTRHMERPSLKPIGWGAGRRRSFY